MKGRDQLEDLSVNGRIIASIKMTIRDTGCEVVNSIRLPLDMTLENKVMNLGEGNFLTS
jgi:hypothetical protein